MLQQRSKISSSAETKIVQTNKNIKKRNKEERKGRCWGWPRKSIPKVENFGKGKERRK